MNTLGLYFGPKVICLAETKLSQLLNKFQVPQELIASPDLEEKVPGEIKMASLFNEEFAKNKIQAKEATIVVSGKDLIIRTFDIPFISPKELGNAINFEVKKYIPFKIEDLVSDFQIQQDRTTKRNMVLFMGIKKESLDKYLAIANQLNIKIDSIEYSAFSTLRLLKLGGAKIKGITALVNIDLKEGDEVNFIVLNNGFPLFSRDIILSSENSLETYQPEVLDPAIVLDKLMRELRISLDFYHRKFPTQNIEKAFLISCDEHRADLEAFMKERGFAVQSLEFKKNLGKDTPYSLSLLKAYSGSLVRAVKSPVRIDLLQVKTRTAEVKAIDLHKLLDFSTYAVSIKPKTIIAAIFIYVLPFVFGYYRTTFLKNELKSSVALTAKFDYVKDSATYEELKRMSDEYTKKLENISEVFQGQFYLTEMLDNLPRIIPGGIVLNSLDLKVEKSTTKERPGKSPSRNREKKTELTLQGYVLREERERAIELINNFNAILKGSPVFNKKFKYINIQSIEQHPGGSGEKDSEAADFNIVCRSS